MSNICSNIVATSLVAIVSVAGSAAFVATVFDATESAAPAAGHAAPVLGSNLAPPSQPFEAHASPVLGSNFAPSAHVVPAAA